MSEQTESANLSAEALRLLFESSPDCYLVLDPSDVIVAASDAYLRATMSQRTELVGQPIFEVFHRRLGTRDAPSEHDIQASLDRVRTRRLPDAMPVHRYDVERSAADGGGTELRYWSSVNSPVFDGDGEVAFVIHRVEDVTELIGMRKTPPDPAKKMPAQWGRKGDGMIIDVLQRSRELAEVNRELENARSATSGFLSQMSHELRTPLTSILGFGELLAMTDLDSEQLEWVDMSLTAAHHLQGLIDDVLDIARIEAGHLSISPEPVSLVAALQDALELTQALATAHNVHIGPPPPESRPLYVLADRQRLRQVLLNVLSNAVKYNDERGRVTLAVDLAVEDRVRVLVTNTGRGLTEDEVARLFVPFERLDAGERGIEGTGLGLVLSLDLMKSMNGNLRASSEPGTNCTFSIELALVHPPAVEEASPPHDNPVEENPDERSRTVLYVEDVASNIRLIEHILHRRPHIKLVSATRGNDAVAKAIQHAPDLVLLDLHLPDIPGEEVLRRLRADERTSGIPVIILSADATSAHRRQLLDAGADDYITKPIGVRQLLEMLDQRFDDTTGS